MSLGLFYLMQLWKNVWMLMLFIETICWSVLYSDCLRRESNFLASTRQVTALCVRILLHCMRVRLRNGYTQAYAQIMQHTHMHKAVTGRVEAKKLLSRRRQSNYSGLISLHDIVMQNVW